MSVIREIQIIIDNEPPTKGEFSIEVEQVEISSFGSDPDPNWTFIDTHGHFHAYTADMKLPTLDERAEWHEYFEPDEETGETGYTTLHLHCRICDEEIRPGRIDRGGYRRFAAGRTSWTVRVNGEARCATRSPSGSSTATRCTSASARSWKSSTITAGARWSSPASASWRSGRPLRG